LVGEDIWGGEYEEWSGREERRGKREEVECLEEVEPCGVKVLERGRAKSN
jgi:hypothetical protein